VIVPRQHRGRVAVRVVGGYGTSAKTPADHYRYVHSRPSTTRRTVTP
jgi:hypothetical protein